MTALDPPNVLLAEEQRTSVAATTPPFGYFGSKVMIARRIVDLMPAHRGYVEPYAGSLSVLLAKPPAVFEVVNDIDQELVTFWRVLRERPDELWHACDLTPHSRVELADAWPIPDDVDDLEKARRVWVKLSQGRGGALRKTGWRYHENPSGRASSMPRTIGGYVSRLPLVAERIREVTLECRPALEIVERYGRADNVLLYVDPPYLFDTRARSGIYQHEMGDEAAHVELAEALRRCRSMVLLSGYPHPLYDDLYAGWHRHEIKAGTGQNAAAGYQERTEVIWSNQELPGDVPLPFPGEEL